MQQSKEVTGLFSHVTTLNERLAGNWKRPAEADAVELAAIERSAKNAIVGMKPRRRGASPAATGATELAAIERAHRNTTWRAGEGTER